MKIHRPNQSQLNVYQNQIEKQQQKQKPEHKDRLQISSEAKRLQQDVQSDKKRAAYVEKIKSQIDSDEYEIDFEKTAKKMIDFWSGRS